MFRKRLDHAVLYGIFLLSLSFAFLSCQSLPLEPSAGKWVGKEMWTRCNLRLFQDKNIYWQNYLDGEVIPVGTRVRLTELTIETATLIDDEDKIYTLYWQKGKEGNFFPFEKEIGKYFVFQDPLLDLKEWNASLRKSVEIGELRLGMPKEAVVISCGFPVYPEEPMNSNTWVYWVNRQKKCAVYFENGIVVQIVATQVVR